MSGSQLTSSLKRGSPTLSISDSVAGAGSSPTRSRCAQRSGALVEARARELVERLGDLGGERQPQPPAALARRAARAPRAAPRRSSRARSARPPGACRRSTRPTQPVVACGQPALDVGRDLQPRVALDDALDVGRGLVGLQRPPLLAPPSRSGGPGIAAHGVDDLAAVGEGEDHGLVAVAVDAQLDVVDGVGFAHAQSRLDGRIHVRSAADGPAPVPRAAPRPRRRAADARRLRRRGSRTG